MEKSRNIKILSIVALVLAICALTLGYAAFSTTLSISSSAIVTPNEDAFSIQIIGVDDDRKFGSLTSSIGGPSSSDVTTQSAVIVNGKTPSISNMYAGFTAPGQNVVYIFKIKNTGQYNVYLQSGKLKLSEGMDNVIVCSPTAGSNVSESLMNAACNDIDVTFGIVENAEDPDTRSIIKTYRNIYNEVGTDKYSLTKFLTEPGQEMSLRISIEYKDNGNIADGAFDVNIAGFEFEFSTVN